MFFLPLFLTALNQFLTLDLQTVAQLKEALHDFIGKIFVKGFLDNDDYFKSQITDNQQVPLEIFFKVRFMLPFACFSGSFNNFSFFFFIFDLNHQAPQVTQITEETELIRHTLMESKVVYIHEDDTVRAIVKPEQNTLILRDIPSSASSDEIVGIFTGAGFAPLGIRSDMNDTWYVVLFDCWFMALQKPTLTN